MPATISVTESQLFTALRTFLLEVIDSGVEVIQTQNNRVPMPKGPFVAMTPIRIDGLSTSVTDYTDTARADTRTTQWQVQLDFYGPQASMQAATVAQLWRTSWAAEQLSSGPIQPLYPGEPLQTTMVNAEMQWESRWTLDLFAQFNPITTVAQQSAIALEIGLAEVDTTFPPGA